MKENPVFLCEKLKEDLPPVFSTEEIKHFLNERYSAPQKKLDKLVSEGYISKILKGFYTFHKTYNRFLIANKIYSPSYISFETALSFHGLIPERVETIYSVTQNRTYNYKTYQGYYTYSSQNISLYSIGMSMERVAGYSVLIANREKALFDAISKHELKAKDYLVHDLLAYVIDSMRIELEDLRSLSLKKMKKLAYQYRNHAPRKLYEALLQIKKEKHE